MSNNFTPAVCGQAVCGNAVCGAIGQFEYGDKYLGFSDYGENPKFDLQTRRMLYVLPGLSVGSDDREVSVSLVYDTHMKNGITALCAGMPSGWKLSAQEFLVIDGRDENGRIIYKYIDGSGYVHKFVPFGRDSARYYDEDGLGLVLTPGSHSIEDARGNVLKFEGGRLTEQKRGCAAKATTKFVYDTDGRLTKMYDSRGMVGSTPARSIEFDYVGGELSAIRATGGGVTYSRINLGYTDEKYVVSYPSGKAVEVTYNSDGKAELFRDTEKNTALKISYAYSPMNVIRISEGNVNGDGAFIEKKFVASSGRHVQELDFSTVCETMFTDEKGVCTLVQLDRRGRIIGTYEYIASKKAYKTLEPERGVSVTPSSGETTNETVNGKPTVSFANSLDLSGVTPQIPGELMHRYFALTFHLKHSCDAKRLCARLKYKISDNTSWLTSEAEVNASAYGAWQRVSIPIDMDTETDSQINNMKLELYVPGRETDVSAVAGDFRIASSPFTSVKIFGNNNEMDIRELKTVYAKFLGNNAGTELVTYTTDGETEYITENDILGSVTEIISPRSAPRGSDLILQDGKKRIACMLYASFTNSLPGENATKEIALSDLYSSTGGYIIDTYSADDKSRTRKKITFSVGGIERIYTTVTVCANGKTFRTAEAGDLITKGETMTEMNIYGKVLQKSDAYGVREANIYDGYGTLKTCKIIGLDGSEIVTRAVTKDETSGKITSVHTPLTGTDLAFDEPFVTLREAYSKSRGSNGAYSRTGAKKAYGYDSHYDKLLLVDEYDGSTKKSGITYAYDGNVMTVSDGASEYKVENDYANGKTKYYVKDNGSYSLVEEVSESETKYCRGSATDTVTVSEDKYGKAESISSDGTSANYVYMSGDAFGNELGSGYAKISTGVNDGFSGRAYEVKRDHAYNECRRTITKNGDSAPVVDIRQITSNVTKYTVPNHPAYRVTVEYDGEKTISPRVAMVKYETESGLTMSDMNFVYTYDSFGRISSKESSVYNNDLVPVHYDYEYGVGAKAQLKVKQVVQTDYGALYHEKADMAEEQAAYHNDGRLASITRTISGKSKNYTETDNYTYDKFGRIISENNTGLGINRTYAYNGKRLKSIIESGSTKYMQYDSRGRLVKITSDEAGNDVLKSYTYDNYGNRISDNNRSYTWTRGRLLASAGSTTYAYDYTGARCRKVYGGNTTEYYYDNGRLICEDGNNSIIYYYDTEGLIGARINGSWRKIVRDMQGNVKYIIGSGLFSSNVIIAQYKYDAHGVCKVYDGNNVERTDSNFIGNIFPLRWKGYYYDSETGLYYNGGRYYDPETGKYLDACGIAEAIAEERLDRNDIMCDNIIELMPYICTVLMGLVKDPTSGESDNPSSGMPWLIWLIIGGVILVGLGIATIVTGGAGAGVVGGLVAGAFKGSLLGAGVGAATGVATGLIDAKRNGGDIFQGMLMGMATGFMSGAIFGAFNGAWGAFADKSLTGARLLVQRSMQAGGNAIIYKTIYSIGSIFESQDIGLMGFFTAGIGGFLTGVFYNKTQLFTVVLAILVNLCMWAGDLIDDI